MKNFTEILSPNRRFGLIIGAMFILIYIIKPIKFAMFLALGQILLFLAIFLPGLLTIPRTGWMKLGDILHKVTNPIIMLLLYLLVFCPVGFCMKLLKLFDKKANINTQSESYWKMKDKQNCFAAMKNQF